MQSYRLEHVAVLEQPLLGYVGLLQLHTQVQVLEHDWLQHTLAPAVSPFLIAKYFIQGVQSTGWLAHLYELCNTTNIQEIKTLVSNMLEVTRPITHLALHV